jgi:alkaline phosphatase
MCYCNCGYRLFRVDEEMFEQRQEGEGDLYEPVISLPEMTQKAILPFQTIKRVSS